MNTGKILFKYQFHCPMDEKLIAGGRGGEKASGGELP